MKKRWLFIPLVVGALAIGITGGTLLAQADGTGTSSHVKTFAARVATILGIDEAKVQSAFDQAAKETQDEALQQKLDQMVQQGRLTQAQADQIKKWYQARPEGIGPGLPFGGFGGLGFSGMRGHHRGFGMGHNMSTPTTPTPST